jgi:hypothetical protein
VTVCNTVVVETMVAVTVDAAVEVEEPTGDAKRGDEVVAVAETVNVEPGGLSVVVI